MERLTTKLLDTLQNVHSYVAKSDNIELNTGGDDFEEIIEKLGKYEDLEEQGLLLKLPCKVGDTVFGFQFPRTDITVISHEKVERIAIETNDAFYDLEDFGEEFFLTKAEAEKALEEMEK